MTLGVENHNRLKNSILELMNGVNRETKVEIIAELTNSLKKKRKVSKDIGYFAGKWISEKTEQEISDEIRAARNFTRNIEGF